jgi:uncharacterized protein YqgV (UPF0045/DUF77 family)
MFLAAQVSLYPLRQPSLTPAIERALETFRAHGLQVESGTMSSVISGEDVALFKALREAFLQTAAEGHIVMIVTVSNACPVPGPRGEVPGGRDTQQSRE